MIYLIITTSINNKVGIVNAEKRKKRYLECIESVLQITKNYSQIKPIIVENNGNPDTYLNVFNGQHNCDIVYTSNNKTNYFHKGVNELDDIHDVIKQYDIKDDDFVIKLTGRYKFLDNTFLEILMKNLDNYDAFVKFYNVAVLKFMYDDCVLGLFAVKCKYIRNFKYEDFKKSPEVEFATSIRNNVDKDRLYEVQDLRLECCFADNLRILSF